MTHSRVVLDTNVLVSAVLFGGPPRQILEGAIAGTFDCFLSLALLDELRDVLQRPKFGLSAQTAWTVAEELSAVCEIVSPTQRLEVIEVDPDDNRVLECALEAKVDFIVSGDTHLLQLGSYAGIRIVNPSYMLAQLERGERPKRPGANGPRWSPEAEP